MVLDQVQEELDALAVRLGRSLTIDSVDGELITYSTQRDDADAARISSILLRRVAPEVREWERRHLVSGARELIGVPANPALGMSARLCLPVRRRDRTLGYLWMLDSGDELSAADLAALRRSADALAGLLDIPVRAPSMVLGRETDRLVRGLFDEGRTEAYTELALALPGLVDGAVQLVAAVAAEPGGGVRPLRSAELGSLAGALTPMLRADPDYVGSWVSTACVLVVARSPRSSSSRLVADVGEIVGRCVGTAVILGLSEPGPFRLPSARRMRHQAVAAAELAALDPALPTPSTWSDLGPYRSLIGPSRAAETPLAPLDEEGAPMLLRTLETYLDLAGDVKATAARLNLHRSSLYYRLDRIAVLLQRDLSDGLVRLDLHLALKTRRARRRTLGQP